MKNFKCPKCGGEYFGVIVDENYRPIVYECHTRIRNGELLPSTIEAIAPRFGRRCGWRGSEAQCMTEVAHEH